MFAQMQQVATSTTGATADQVIEGLVGLAPAFGMGVIEGLVAVFGVLMLISNVTLFQNLLAKTSADWVLYAVRAVAILGGAVTAALLSGGDVAAVVGALVAAFPAAWSWIQKARTEFAD